MQGKITICLRRIRAIASTTAAELYGQPAVLLLTLGGVMAIALIPFLQLHSFGEAISCGKRARASMKLNQVLGYISAGLGIPLVFYLLFMQSYTAVTPFNMLYYMLLWLCPVLLSSFGANRR